MFQLGTVEYIFFPSTHRTFSRIEYVGGHKIALKNIKSEIIQIMLSDHNGIKLDINIRNKFREFASMWKSSNS